MSKLEIWPTTGKLKKAAIILAIVVIVALLMVLIEEKAGFKLNNKAIMPVVLLCVGIWFYKPKKEDAKG